MTKTGGGVSRMQPELMPPAGQDNTDTITLLPGELLHFCYGLN